MKGSSSSGNTFTRSGTTSRNKMTRRAGKQKTTFLAKTLTAAAAISSFTSNFVLAAPRPQHGEAQGLVATHRILTPSTPQQLQQQQQQQLPVASPAPTVASTTAPLSPNDGGNDGEGEDDGTTTASVSVPVSLCTSVAGASTLSSGESVAASRVAFPCDPTSAFGGPVTTTAAPAATATATVQGKTGDEDAPPEWIADSPAVQAAQYGAADAIEVAYGLVLDSSTTSSSSATANATTTQEPPTFASAVREAVSAAVASVVSSMEAAASASASKALAQPTPTVMVPRPSAAGTSSRKPLAQVSSTSSTFSTVGSRATAIPPAALASQRAAEASAAAAAQASSSNILIAPGRMSRRSFNMQQLEQGVYGQADAQWLLQRRGQDGGSWWARSEAESSVSASASAPASTSGSASDSLVASSSVASVAQEASSSSIALSSSSSIWSRSTSAPSPVTATATAAPSAASVSGTSEEPSIYVALATVTVTETPSESESSTPTSVAASASASASVSSVSDSSSETASTSVQVDESSNSVAAIPTATRSAITATLGEQDAPTDAVSSASLADATGVPRTAAVATATATSTADGSSATASVIAGDQASSTSNDNATSNSTSSSASSSLAQSTKAANSSTSATASSFAASSSSAVAQNDTVLGSLTGTNGGFLPQDDSSVGSSSSSGSGSSANASSSSDVASAQPTSLLNGIVGSLTGTNGGFLPNNSSSNSSAPNVSGALSSVLSNVASATATKTAASDTSTSSSASATSAKSSSTQTSSSTSSAAISETTGRIADSGQVLIGYWPDWTAGSLPPESIDYSKYDVIFYAFALPTSNFGLSYNYGSSALLKRLVKAAHAKGKKVVLSIGGWGGSTYFSPAVRDDISRSKFISSIMKEVNDNNLDGVDFDWEYPYGVGAGNNQMDPYDTKNFQTFLQQMRAKMPSPKIIAAAVAHQPWTASNGQPVSSVQRAASALDYILLMNYDVWGSSSTPGPNAPLANLCGNSSQPSASAAAGVKQWAAAGMPRSKILLGIPAYGYVSNSGASSLIQRRGSNEDGRIEGHYLPSAHRKPVHYADVPSGRAGRYDRRQAQYDARSLTQGQNNFNVLVSSGALKKSSDGKYVAGSGWTRKWDSCSSTPFLYNGKQVITYDDPSSIIEKGQFTRQTGIAGMGIWSIDADTKDSAIASAAISGMSG